MNCNKNLEALVMQQLQDMLIQHNIYVPIYKSAFSRSTKILQIIQSIFVFCLALIDIAIMRPLQMKLQSLFLEMR